MITINNCLENDPSWDSFYNLSKMKIEIHYLRQSEHETEVLELTPEEYFDLLEDEKENFEDRDFSFDGSFLNMRLSDFAENFPKENSSSLRIGFEQRLMDWNPKFLQ